MGHSLKLRQKRVLKKIGNKLRRHRLKNEMQSPEAAGDVGHLDYYRFSWRKDSSTKWLNGNDG